jgi:lipoprotein NlpI
MRPRALLLAALLLPAPLFAEEAPLKKAQELAAAGKNEDALTAVNEALRLDPKSAAAYDLRGSLHFKLGKAKESVADFNRYLELRPDERNGHWRRGISLYYAGEYDEGRKQFEGYEKVDTNDVENAVWHFLCVARPSGVAKARASILKIGTDRRVPMAQVYQLFAGKIKPDDVLEAVKAGDPSEKERNARLFYAHLYLGLYHEVNGDAKKALEHLKTATDHRVEHYMWDVARVHRDLLKR